jgi:hypothetical protein
MHFESVRIVAAQESRSGEAVELLVRNDVVEHLHGTSLAKGAPPRHTFLHVLHPILHAHDQQDNFNVTRLCRATLQDNPRNRIICAVDFQFTQPADEVRTIKVHAFWIEVYLPLPALLFVGFRRTQRTGEKDGLCFVGFKVAIVVNNKRCAPRVARVNPNVSVDIESIYR